VAADCCGGPARGALLVKESAYCWKGDAQWHARRPTSSSAVTTNCFHINPGIRNIVHWLLHWQAIQPLVAHQVGSGTDVPTCIWIGANSSIGSLCWCTWKDHSCASSAPLGNSSSATIPFDAKVHVRTCSATNITIFKLKCRLQGVASLHERASEGQHTLWASTPLLSALCTLNSLQVSFTTSLSRAL
jgi:hypothetical protein